jgi:hypothetical protein
LIEYSTTWVKKLNKHQVNRRSCTYPLVQKGEKRRDSPKDERAKKAQRSNFPAVIGLTRDKSKATTNGQLGPSELRL